MVASGNPAIHDASNEMNKMHIVTGSRVDGYSLSLSLDEGRGGSPRPLPESESTFTGLLTAPHLETETTADGSAHVGRVDGADGARTRLLGHGKGLGDELQPHAAAPRLGQHAQEHHLQDWVAAGLLEQVRHGVNAHHEVKHPPGTWVAGTLLAEHFEERRHPRCRPHLQRGCEVLNVLE